MAFSAAGRGRSRGKAPAWVGGDAPMEGEAKGPSVPPHLLHQGGQLRVEGDVVVPQAQLFGEGDELHPGFVLVGAACRLVELPGGGSAVSSIHRGPPDPPPGTPGPATPSPATSAPPNQAEAVPTPIQAHAEVAVVPTLRPMSGGSTASSSACRMRSGQASTFTLRAASAAPRGSPRSQDTPGSLPGCC